MVHWFLVNFCLLDVYEWLSYMFAWLHFLPLTLSHTTPWPTHQSVSVLMFRTNIQHCHWGDITSVSLSETSSPKAELLASLKPSRLSIKLGWSILKGWTFNTDLMSSYWTLFQLDFSLLIKVAMLNFSEGIHCFPPGLFSLTWNTEINTSSVSVSSPVSFLPKIWKALARSRLIRQV